METTNNLSWTATADKPWIHLDPSSGSGDKNIEVTVDNYDGYSEDVTGTVTVSCDACKITTEPTVIEVCRCACNCDNMQFTQKVTNIPEGGLGVENPLVTYSIDNRCNANRIGAKIINTKTSVEQSLTVNSSGIYLQSPIPYNEDEESITYNIVITFDGPERECRTFQIVQDELECNCNNVVKPNFRWSGVFAGTDIPQSGLTAGTEVFTYTHKQYCPSNSSRIYGKVSYGSYSADLTIENGIGKLSRKIGENTGVGERTIRIDVYYIGTDGSGSEEACTGTTLYQVGCNCNNALIDESFEFNIPSPGVNNSAAIGSYAMNHPETSCSDSVLKVSLKNDKTGQEYYLTVSNGIIYLAEGVSIEENIEKENVSYTFSVIYNDVHCFTGTTIQPGVACNCEDIDTKIQNPNEVPQSGLTGNSLITTYTQGPNDCEDFKVTVIKAERDGEILDITLPILVVDTVRNQIKIAENSSIGINDAIDDIIYTVKVEYRVHEIYRECDPFTFIQKGLDCSCKKNVKLKVTTTEPDGKAHLPSVGTNGQFVEVAVGDVGLRNSRGEILKSCGRIFGFSSASILISPETPPEEAELGNKILTELIVDPEHPDINYLYSIKANVMDKGPNFSDALNGNVYFVNEKGQSEFCDGITFGIIIDANACDCRVPEPISTKIPCEGSLTNKIELFKLEGVHKDMYFNAEYIGENQNITNIEIRRERSSSLTAPKDYVIKVLANVKANDSGGERIVGKIKLIAICNAVFDDDNNLISGWQCNPEGTIIDIIQEKCPNCDCDNINSKFHADGGCSGCEINIPYIVNEYVYGDSYYDDYPPYYDLKGGVPNCVIVKLEGQIEDEENPDYGWLIKTYEEYGETKEWFRAKILDRIVSNNREIFKIKFIIKNHRNESVTVKIIAGYENDGSFVECSFYNKTVTDNACDCEIFYNDYYYYKSDGKYKLVIGANEMEDKYRFFDTNYCDCLEVWILDESKVVGDPDRYLNSIEYKHNESVIFTATVTTSDDYYYDCLNAIKVILSRKLEPIENYNLPVVIGYKLFDENGIRTGFSECQVAELNISQDVCSCEKYSTRICNSDGTLKEYELTISKGETSGSIYVVGYSYESDFRNCIKIKLIDPIDSSVFYHKGDTFTLSDEGTALMDISLLGYLSYGNAGYTSYGVEAKLKNGITLTKTYVIEGVFYVDGPDGDIDCCHFKVNIKQTNCNCYDDIKGKISNKSITNTNCETNNSVEIVDYVSPCAKIQLYLLCDTTEEGCDCDAHPDKDGDGTAEDSICIYTSNYPQKYNYLSDMPSYTNSSLSISFNSPYDGSDGGSSRITRFIGFWVDNDGNFVKDDDYYCAKEFTITEYFIEDCTCVEKNTWPYKLANNISIKLSENEDNTYYYVPENSNVIIAEYYIDKTSKTCLTVERKPQNPANCSSLQDVVEYDESRGMYKVTVSGTFHRTTSESTEKISFNFTVRKGDEQFEFLTYDININA